MVKRSLFTSESVTEGHPDKVCDQISDSILDEFLRQDSDSRVAVESMTTTGIVFVAGEVTSKGRVHVQKIVRDTIREIGYDKPDYGFDCDSCLRHYTSRARTFRWASRRQAARSRELATKG
jgi:S-adenosylmethionine synthetase